MLLQQDKGRGIVIINRNSYTNRFLNILNTEQFRKLDRNPTKPVEVKSLMAPRKNQKSPVKPRIFENLSNWFSACKILGHSQAR